MVSVRRDGEGWLNVWMGMEMEIGEARRGVWMVLMTAIVMVFAH